MSYHGLSEEEARDLWAQRFFRGYCPYTGKYCKKWNCHKCEVEKKEREYAESEEEE